MRIVIVGAGSVGKTICRDLLRFGKHEISLIDMEATGPQQSRIQGVQWVVGDSCDPDVLKEAGAKKADILVAATHDDQTNLVTTLLAKTEFGVQKTIARINHPKNAFMFDASWGVDESVSMPDAMLDLIEEAVAHGDVIPVYSFKNSPVGILKYRIEEGSEFDGAKREQFLQENSELILLAIVRGESIISPLEEVILEAGDEVILLGKSPAND